MNVRTMSLPHYAVLVNNTKIDETSVDLDFKICIFIVMFRGDPYRIFICISEYVSMVLKDERPKESIVLVRVSSSAHISDGIIKKHAQRDLSVQSVRGSK
jgi:hypothetical protein